jgi:nucleoside-diphosphate-sugar epimerase
MNLEIEVCCTTRRTKFNQEGPEKWFSIDFTTEIPSRAQFDFVPDIVFFCGTSTNIHSAKHESSDANLILNGANYFFSNVLQSNSDMRIINLSSGAVYGTNARKKFHITNQDEVSEDNVEDDFYPIVKIRLEKLFDSLNQLRQIKTTNARIFNVYGNGMPLDQHFAIGNFLNDAKTTGKVKISGNPNSSRGYMHLADLVLTLINLAVHREVPSLNIGSSQGITMFSLAKLILKATNNSVENIEMINQHAPVNHYVRAPMELHLENLISSNYVLSESIREWSELIS